MQWGGENSWDGGEDLQRGGWTGLSRLFFDGVTGVIPGAAQRIPVSEQPKNLTPLLTELHRHLAKFS